MSRWRGGAIAGLALIACAVFGASAAADGGHLPGFSVADHKVAIKDLPETLQFTFGGIPGAKGAGLPHVGHGPVWFGEVERPKGTIYVAGNRRWACIGEVKTGEIDGGTSCTTRAGAREDGLFDISSSCGKGPPRHFRVVGLLPDGITAMRIEKLGGAGGRTVPVIENTLAFTIGRENFVLRGSGSPAAEEFERSLPLAQAAERFGDDLADCSTYIFAEAKKPN